MLRIAYGEASFENLIHSGELFIDKTSYIAKMEATKKFFFIRPRRMGKSLWISVLQSYYDCQKKEQFDELFNNLYIHKNPTELRNTYLILKFDFSGLDTSNEKKLQESFHYRVRQAVSRFWQYYRDYLSFQLVQRFSFENRLQDHELKSLLFFFGLLTMSPKPNQFLVPNHVIRTLHWEYFQNYLEENGVEFDTRQLHKTIEEMCEHGRVGGLKNVGDKIWKIYLVIK